MSNADSKIEASILLRVRRDGQNNIYENLKLQDNDKFDYAKLIPEYDKFCEPQHQVFVSRHQLLCVKQESLPIKAFETKLR